MALTALANVALARNQPQAAADTFKRAIVLFEKREIAVSPLLAGLNLDLAKALHVAGQYAESAAVIEKLKQLEIGGAQTAKLREGVSSLQSKLVAKR